MQQEDWERLEKLAAQVQGQNLRPTVIRTTILGGLFIGGVLFIISSAAFQQYEFVSGLLLNLGCEFIGSIIIFIAVEQLAKSLQEQSQREKELMYQIKEMKTKSQEASRATNKPPIISDITKSR